MLPIKWPMRLDSRLLKVICFVKGMFQEFNPTKSIQRISCFFLQTDPVNTFVSIVSNIVSSIAGQFVVCVAVRITIHAIINIFVDVTVKVATNHERIPVKYSKLNMK